MERRKFLGIISGSMTGLAGCLNSGSDEGRDNNENTPFSNDSRNNTSEYNTPKDNVVTDEEPTYPEEWSEKRGELDQEIKDYVNDVHPDIVDFSEDSVEIKDEGKASVIVDDYDPVNQDRHGLNISIIGEGTLANIKFEDIGDEELNKIEDLMYQIVDSAVEKYGSNFENLYDDGPAKEGDVISALDVRIEGEDEGLAALSYTMENPASYIGDLPNMSDEELRKSVEDTLIIF